MLMNICCELQWRLLCCSNIFSFSQFSSFTQSCPALCNPVDCSMPGLPVHHQLRELTQTHVHLILCHLLLLLPSIFPSIRVFSESALRIRWPKYWSFSFSISPSSWFPLGLTGLILQSKGLSRVFSNTTVQKHQVFGTHFLHSPTLTSIHDHWKNHSLD